MDYNVLLIPAIVFFIGIMYMLLEYQKRKHSGKLPKNTLALFTASLIPKEQNVNMRIITLLDESESIPYIWVLSFNQDSLYFIPAVASPSIDSIQKYKDSTEALEWIHPLNSLSADNQHEDIGYIHISEITKFFLDKDTRTIALTVGAGTKTFKYENLDCFGVNQEAGIIDLETYLKLIAQ